MKDFDKNGPCPICRRDFRNDCPHSLGEVESFRQGMRDKQKERALDDRIRRIVLEELARLRGEA